MDVNAQQNILDFNHIDATLSKETVEMLKSLYVYYHKKHYGYENLYHSFQRTNLLCNIVAGKAVITSVVAGGITLKPVVFASLTGFSLVVKEVSSFKQHDKKQRKPTSPGLSTRKFLMRSVFTSEVSLLTKKTSSTS